MDVTHGLLGLLGFLLVEFGWLIGRNKSPKFEGKPLYGHKKYLLTIALFGSITTVVVAIIGPSDLSAAIWPPVVSNPTLAEAARSIELGIACLLVYKSPSKFGASAHELDGPRTETTSVVTADPADFSDFVRAWSRGFR